MTTKTNKARKKKAARKSGPAAEARGAKLYNIVRAAELLGLKYETIARGVETGELDDVEHFEGKGGKPHILIRAPSLRSFRDRLAQRYETYELDAYQQKAQELRKLAI